MKYYIDILIKVDKDITQDQVMNLLYTRVHKMIVKLNTSQIGVSFPDCDVKPGYVLRLHGDTLDLVSFQARDWLEEVIEYCEIREITTVPENVQYRTISRIRSNMSKSKLERLKRRGSIKVEDENVYRSKMLSLSLDNPYFNLISASTSQRYKLFIKLGQLNDFSIQGGFDSYGLSSSTTIPWF